MNSMPRQRGVTEFQSKRTLSNPNPNGLKTRYKPLYNPKWVYHGILEV